MDRADARRLARALRDELRAVTETAPVKRMLVAYDGSAEARRALSHVTDFAHADDRVTVINVVPEPGISAAIEPPAEQRNRQRHLLEEARRVMAARDLAVETLAPCGNAAAAILDAAEALVADVIVVAPHPRRTPHVLGSVTGRVVRAAKCDVLVVHVADAGGSPSA